MIKLKTPSKLVFSKPTAITLFILLSIVGFYLGTYYPQVPDTKGGGANTNVFKLETEISEKPRDKVISYTVEDGDTLPIIARKFNISKDTVRWESNLADDNVTVGQKLQILPTTGVSHVVVEGDTVQSLAKIYKTDPTKIINFPYNEFENTETFTLKIGKKIIIPDGKK